MNYFRENIEKMAGYVPGFQPDAADIVKLNTNENPYPPSPDVLEAIGGVSAERLRRYPQPLADDFRRAASEVLAVPADHIICANGGDDLLTMCFRAFCDGDRPVAYPVPTYTLYETLARLQGCGVLEVALDSPDLTGDLADTAAALTIVCNPNAPTGSRIEQETLARLAEKMSGVLLIDEAYVDFADGDCLELAEQFDNVIILRSMSKGYSLAGIRFGYGIARPGLIEGLLKVKDSYNVDVVAIGAATAAIRDQRYFMENVEKIKDQRQRLTEKLRGLGFEVNQSQTNFVLAGCSGLGAEGFGVKNIYERLAERNIYVRYFDVPNLADKLRITVGTEEQNGKLIEALKGILETIS